MSIQKSIYKIQIFGIVSPKSDLIYFLMALSDYSGSDESEAEEINADEESESLSDTTTCNENTTTQPGMSL